MVDTRLVDAVIQAYVSWREECANLRDAYEFWAGAPATDARLAFSAYLGALDGEASAAAAYADLLKRLAVGAKVAGVDR